MPKGVLQVELPGMSWFGLNYQRLTLQPDEGLTVIGYCIYLFLPANTRPSPTSFFDFPSCCSLGTKLHLTLMNKFVKHLHGLITIIKVSIHP